MRLLERLQQGLAQTRDQGLQRRRRLTDGPCGARQALHAGHGMPPRLMLNFSSNDYLGLAGHPALVKAMGEGASTFGAGSGGSHLVLGHSRAHDRLEQALAEWLRPHIPHAQALFLCSGYMANLAVLTTLGTQDAAIFSEALNHASLIDGARLARASVHRFPHRDLATLEALLAGSAAPVKIIVSDTVFSMDGSLADVAGLLQLAERHDAWLVLDDAHGFGVLGTQGRGALEHAGLASDRIVYVGTLSKAAGISGAFVAAHETVIDHLVQNARSYIYTTASPPAVAHALSCSLAIMGGEEGSSRRQVLAQRIEQFRHGVSALLAHDASACLLDSSTAIQPLVLGSNARTMAFAARLDEQGILVGAIRPPTVPLDTARLRITLTAAHSSEDVERLISALRGILAETGRQAA